MRPIRADLQLNCEHFLGAIRSVDNAISGFKARVTGFAATFTGLAAAGALVALQFAKAKEALDLGGELIDMRENTGQSVAELVVLRQAFDNAVDGAQNLPPALASLQKSLSGINEEGQPTKDVFDRLGLSIHALRDMQAIEQFTTLGRALREIPDEADRARAAMEIFGGRGRKMLAFLMDESAISTAREQVGGLASTMEQNAESFDAVGDSIGTLKTKVLQFYAAFAGQVSGGSEGFLERLSKTDFTEAGEAAGQIASHIGELIRLLLQVSPIFAGIAAKMTATTLLGKLRGTELAASWKVIWQAPMYQLALFRAQVSATGFSFKTLQITAKTALTGIAATAKAVVASLGVVGAAITVATFGFAAALEHIEKMKAGVRSIRTVADERATSAKSAQANFNNVASVSEREEALKSLSSELENVRQRLSDVDQEYEDLTSADRNFLKEQFSQWAHQLELNISQLQRISPEILNARRHERERRDAMEESRKKAEELRSELAKGIEELAKAKKQDSFGALSAIEQRAALLKEINAHSSASIDKEIQWLALKRDGNRLSDPEAARLAKLLELRKQLVEIERKITTERAEQRKAAEEKAAEEKKKAQEATAKRQDFEKDFAVEMRKLMADAFGTDEAMRLAEREQRRHQYISQAKDAGVDPMRAEQLAAAKVGLEDAAEKQEREAAENAKTLVVADSNRRVGLGGRAFGGRQDPLVKAHQDSRRAVAENTAAVKALINELRRKPERIVVPGEARFSK